MINNTVDKIEVKGLSGESLDILEDKVNKLKEIFPEAICEGKIDFERLSEELGKFKEDKEERYRFEWAGKSEAIKISQTPSLGTLRPCKEDSENWGTTENLYIEGDNLEVLKLLQKSYQNKVKMIYIDPPYNTECDFIYNDKTKESIENYLILTEQVDIDGRNENTKRESAGRYHTNWLNMMYPRLMLARNLLTRDGIIFISIDANELFNLKKVCDEIFGEENFIANIVIEITKTQGMKVKAAKEGSVVKNHEYILCYAKQNTNKKIVKNILFDENKGYDEHFSTYIQEKNGCFEISSLTNKLIKNDKIKKEFERVGLIKNDKISIKDIGKGIEISTIIEDYIYRELANDIYQDMACNIEIDDEIKSKLDHGVLKYKEYLLKKTSGNKIRQYSSLKESLNISDEYNSKFGRVTIRGDMWKGFYSDMMNVSKEGDCEFKNGKKPKRLIKQLAKWIGIVDDDVILDFFSGSGTTMHSIMEYNQENNINSKVILVQIPQVIQGVDKESKKYISYLEKEKIKPIISEVAKTRIRRAGNKIITENKDKEAIEDLDIGFKVFKLDSTNIKKWDSSSKNDLQTKLFEMKESFVDGRTEEDILYELMLKAGIDITYSVEEIEFNDKKIFNIGFGELIVCLSDVIDVSVANEIIKYKNERTRVIFKECGFKDDSTKINVLNILERNKIIEVMSI